jgi:hypothetical protein
MALSIDSAGVVVLKRVRQMVEPRWQVVMIGLVATIVLISGVAFTWQDHGAKAGPTAERLRGNQAQAQPITQESGGTAGAAAGSTVGSAPIAAGSSAQAPAIGLTPAVAASAPPVATVATKVIKTGTIELQVAASALSPIVDKITSTTALLGGYMSSATTTEGGATPTADLTARVPAAQFETLLSRVRALGHTVSVTSAGQDVTGTYVDLQARITAAEASREQYLTILTRASAIGDVLAVQQQIDTIQSELEQLQGQLNVLQDQTSYGTLTIHLDEPAAPAPKISAPPTGLSLAWAHARHSFTHGAESVIAATGGVAIFLVCVALLAALGAATRRSLQRRRPSDPNAVASGN